MAKVFHILKLAESFYKKALWSYFVTQSLIKNAADDLLGEAEKYDIKDEELYNQFESFMSAYKELLDSLRIDPENLTPEAMEEAAQLIDTLNTRYERIISNPYLNMASEGYDEDFDPGEFTSFIQRIVRDAESKLKTIAGEDVNISEMRAAQYAQEFNDIQVDRGDQKMTYTGNKVQQLLEARRNWFRNLMFVKKLGKSHPEYVRYENYINSRHEHYQNIVSDPTRKAAYREKSRNRQKIWYGTDKRKDVVKERAKKVRELKESGSLAGHTTKFQQQLASLKKDTAAVLKNALKKDPAMKAFDQAIDAAERQVAADPSPANQANLEQAKRKAAEFIANTLTNNPRTVKLNEDLPKLYEFRDACRALELAMKGEGAADTQAVIAAGTALMQTYSKTYGKLMETVGRILESLSKTGNP